MLRQPIVKDNFGASRGERNNEKKYLLFEHFRANI